MKTPMIDIIKITEDRQMCEKVKLSEKESEMSAQVVMIVHAKINTIQADLQINTIAIVIIAERNTEAEVEVRATVEAQALAEVEDKAEAIVPIAAIDRVDVSRRLSEVKAEVKAGRKNEKRLLRKSLSCLVG